MQPTSTKQQNKSAERPIATLPRHKKLIFTGVMLGIPVLILLILEMSLRIANYGQDLRLFVPTPDKSSPYYGMNLEVAQRYYYYYSDQFDPRPRKDLFLKRKPENGFRIFILGGSTAAGYPFGNNVSFARILQRRLADTFPEYQIEVINTAIAAVNSYTLLDFMDEILAQEPDAILIYAGQNEYYGPFGPVGKLAFLKNPRIVNTILKLQRFKTVLLIRNIFRSRLQGIMFQPIINSTGSADSDFSTKMSIPCESKSYQQGLNQFHHNLRLILKKAHRAKVPVIISEVVSNIRDCPPFPTSDINASAAAVREYAQARQLESTNPEAARIAYYQAKDLDPTRCRAPEAINEIIHELANEHNCSVVPLKSVFEQVSPNGLIGDNLMLDHCHPTFDGYFLMAEAFYDVLHESQLIQTEWKIDPARNTEFYLKNWGFTRLDSLYAELIIRSVKSGWPYQKEIQSTKTLVQAILHNFEIRTKADSVIIRVLGDRGYSLLTGHYDLAVDYENRQDFEAALAEYKALIYSIPTYDLFYERATKILLKLKRYEQTDELLRDALKYNRSATIFKWLGIVNLQLNHLRDGINYLNRSNNLTAGDQLVLQNLVRAYYNLTEFERGDQIFARLASRDTTTIKLKNYRRIVLEKSNQARLLFENALTNFRNKNPQPALTALQNSLQTHETAAADDLMGIVLMQNNKTADAVRYFEKAVQMSLDDPPARLFNLTRAYREIGEYAKAKKSYIQLKDNYPDFEGLGQLTALMEK